MCTFNKNVFLSQLASIRPQVINMQSKLELSVSRDKGVA